jgi:hypothetical protein
MNLRKVTHYKKKNILFYKHASLTTQTIADIFFQLIFSIFLLCSQIYNLRFNEGSCLKRKKTEVVVVLFFALFAQNIEILR